MTTFSDLGLIAPLLKALAAEGYAHPTPIQAQAIPLILSGQDLLGVAQTGTGKTAAFALPLLQLLDADRRAAGPKACRVLVLSPTRELAGQIADSFRAYGRFAGYGVQCVYGGASLFKQKKALERGTDVLVATPGRLLDLVAQKAVRLDRVERLVLDEADQMMDMGFIRPLRQIVAMTPAARQTLFFSATMPAEIRAMADAFLSSPASVTVTPVASTAERVDQRVIHVAQPNKQALLAALLAEDASITRAIVFVRTKHGADRVVEKLAAAGVAAEAIHGNKRQNARERALEAFRKGEARLLVATDIAARGIDVDHVSHVINFDLPNVPEAYVHRIGRTARAGREGIAISFCDRTERAFLRDIERLTRQPVAVAEHALGAAPAALRAGEERRDHHAPAGRRGPPPKAARPDRRPDQPKDRAHDRRPERGHDKPPVRDLGVIDRQAPRDRQQDRHGAAPAARPQGRRGRRTRVWSNA